MYRTKCSPSTVPAASCLLVTWRAVAVQVCLWEDTFVHSAMPSTQSSRWSVKCVVSVMTAFHLLYYCFCCSVFETTEAPLHWFVCVWYVVFSRFDSGVGSPSRQIFPPPFPAPSFYREFCGGASGGQVVLIHINTYTVCCFSCVFKAFIIYYLPLSHDMRAHKNEAILNALWCLVALLVTSPLIFITYTLNTFPLPPKKTPV